MSCVIALTHSVTILPRRLWPVRIMILGGGRWAVGGGRWAVPGRGAKFLT